ncbi:hypothetical protein LTR84_004325 [Exophiala bonariae]|uniref:Dipeptidase n=1 Tax=Exophiala bonariae TaxID=1690606 RepID=A0AAV9N4F5_9EURO|nr:hypothetical protein LTR84_004325 [Exophiala bonariae]
MSSKKTLSDKPTPVKQQKSKSLTLPALISGFAFLGITVFSLATNSNHFSWRPSVFSSDTQQTTAEFVEERLDPQDYAGRARQILRSTPLIDGHNDFPYLLRHQLHNQIYDRDFENERLGSQTDFQKMKQGLMGGQFWSVFVPCPEDLVPGVKTDDPNKRVPDLNEPNWAVRDTLEQIDITKRLVEAYPESLELCYSPECVRRVHRSGKVASMIGIEGGHQTGNSLGALRLLFDTGARYMTLTHNCDNAFGTSWVSMDLKTGKDAGLTEFGRSFVAEANRLGLFVDISHVSHQTMRDVLEVAKAPVIFSHSGAYSVHGHLRNVPDDVLRAVKQNGGVVMIPVISLFLNSVHPEEVTVEDVIDHILWVAEVAGWDHVGLGSDFDGSTFVVKGIEDVSQWPNLIEHLLARGNVTDEQAKQLVGNNLLRAWSDMEKVAEEIQLRGDRPREESWEGRFWETDNFDVPRMFPEVK